MQSWGARERQDNLFRLLWSLYARSTDFNLSQDQASTINEKSGWCGDMRERWRLQPAGEHILPEVGSCDYAVPATRSIPGVPLVCQEKPEIQTLM